MNIKKSVSQTVKAIKKAARGYTPPAIGYDAILNFGPISIWVDDHYPGNIEDLSEEDYWELVNQVENRLEKWTCIEQSV